MTLSANKHVSAALTTRSESASQYQLSAVRTKYN